MEVIIFTIAHSSYAIDLEKISKIVELEEELTPVAGSHEYIDGILAYDERTISVLNLPKLFNMEKADQKKVLILYTDEEEEFFICVNSIVGVQAVDDKNIKPFSASKDFENLVELDGVIDMKSSPKTQLITIIKSIKLPK